MKKYIISIIAILLISIVVLSMTYEVHALDIDDLGTMETYKQNSGDNQALVDIGNIIVNIVRTIGTAISGLMLTIVGIKYIMGSVEEKAEYKQTMWPYVLGAILIFAGSSFASMLYEMFN